MVNSLTHLKKKKQVQGDDLGITSDDKGKKSKGKRREILNVNSCNIRSMKFIFSDDQIQILTKDLSNNNAYSPH